MGASVSVCLSLGTPDGNRGERVERGLDSVGWVLGK